MKTRKALGRLSYSAYTAAAVAAIVYFFFWSPFLHHMELADPPALEGPRYVDQATVRRLGTLRADRPSSFPNFTIEKPATTRRVCAFGDSFTYGDEVTDGHDFPAQLSGVYRQRGHDAVEVINFGNSWYGFHQAYIAWDDIGRRFDCDAVLLGPDCFQPERDTTFNHTGLAFPYYLHARYVLEGEDVRLIEVTGETPKERFDDYFAFVPTYRYLRYDRSPPAALRALLPSGRTVGNPFYYSLRTVRDEAYATYGALLRRWAREGIPIVVLHSLPELVEMVNGLGEPVITAVRVPRTERFPYSAPGGHYSSFGNRMVAEQYFALLEDPKAAVTLLDFEDVEADATAELGDRVPTAVAESVSSYDEIVVRLDGTPAGFFAVASVDSSERGGTPGDFHESGVENLIALVPKNASVLDAAVVPVAGGVAPGDDVVLEIRHGGEPTEVFLGTLSAVGSRTELMATTVAGLAFPGDVTLTPDDSATAELLGRPGGTVTLSAGDVALLSGRTGDLPVHLAPASDPLRSFRVDAGQYRDIDDLPVSGVATLALGRADAETVELPLARWRKREVAYDATGRP